MTTSRMPERFLLVACLVVAGCAASIERHGYAIPEGHQLADCEMPIQNSLSGALNEFELIGQIEVTDSSFSIDCDERVVLQQLTLEACYLDADLINITKEERPDSRSTCYRAKADFLRFKDRSVATPLASDPKYAPDEVRKRAQATHGRNQAGIAGAAAGAAIGAAIAP